MRDILHCDMNNFYATVECSLNPELKKYPVAVCGNVDERHGIVLAKNYQAKDCGVKTGETIWQARQKCRDLVVVPPHFEEYIKYSGYAKEIYLRYTNLVEPYGMDECWLDISGTSRSFGTPEKIAHEIRETIKLELGLTVSIGVSFNKIFSKLGSDMKKPDAVTVINKEDFKSKIWDLPANELLGVGKATERMLDKYYIKTIGDLAKTNPEVLRNKLGKNGETLYIYANGYDTSPVKHIDYKVPIKSVGHGITTSSDMENNEQVWKVILELSQDIGHKLKKHGLCANGVSIHVKDTDLSTRQWQSKLSIPTQSPLFLAQSAFLLCKERYGWEKNVRAITIQAIDLSSQDTPFQADLFGGLHRNEKQQKLDVCVDEIRKRFGKTIIRNAVLFDDIKMPINKTEITMPTGML